MKNRKKQSITIKLAKDTRILFFENYLIVKGHKGTIAYPGFKDKNKYTLILKKNCITISIGCFLTNKLKLANLIQNLVFGVHFLFSKKLIFMGIGLRSWIKTLKDNKKILLIKAGFSQDISIIIPKSILVFSLRPTVILIRGLNNEKITQLASFIRSHKKPENYKGIGIQYQNESLLLKPGKKN